MLLIGCRSALIISMIGINSGMNSSTGSLPLQEDMS